MPHTSWSIIETRGRAGLEQLEADWRRLYAEMPLRTSFLAYEASLAFVDRLLATPDRLRCVALTDGRQVRAICLLEPRTDRMLGPQIRVWGVLRLRHGRQAHVICPDDQARRELIPALVTHLQRNPEGRPLLFLGPLPVSSTLWDGLRQLGRGEYCVDPRESVWLFDCTKPFDELISGLSRKRRRNLRNAQNRLAALEDVRFVTAREAADLETEFATFLDVEASGWKGETGTRSALRFRGQQPLFFGDLAANMRGDVDHCEINALYAEGRCLASLFCTRTGATYSALKIGIDEAYGRVSPGQLLLANTLEHCCQDPGIERLDMVSDAAWLQSWRPDAVALQTAYVALARWPGRPIVGLLRFRFGHARRLVRWLRGKRAAIGREDVGRDSARFT